MARGIIGAAYSIDRDAYNKGVQDAIDLRNMQRAETARRLIAQGETATATPVEDYKDPFAGQQLQDQNKLMPDPRAGGQYMTIPGSEQDRMLAAQDKMDFPDSPPKVPMTRDSVIRQAARQQQDVGLGAPRAETEGMIFGLGPRFTADPKMTDEAVLSRDIAGDIAFQTFQPGDRLPGVFTGTTASSPIIQTEKADEEPETKGIVLGAGPKFKTQTGNTGNFGKATANLSTLKDDSGLQTNPQMSLIGDTGVVGATIRDNEARIMGETTGKPGVNTQKLIDNRKFIVDRINQARNQAAEYQRLASIYRRVGDVANYTQYTNLANQTANGAADLRNSLIEYDDSITLSIAKDALADLSVTNNASRAAQVLSKYTNQNIEIIPNSYDNNYTLLVDGQVREVLDKASIQDKVKSLTDKAYFDFKIKNQRERALIAFKAGVDKDLELAKIQGQIKKELLSTKAQIVLERIKQSNFEFKSNGDGTGFIMRNGILYRFNPYRQDPLDEDRLQPGFEEMRLELVGGNAYEAGFAD